MKCSHWGEGTNRQRLQMEFGQWSEIPIQKIDFVHKLEFEVSKGRITQVLHQVSAILWLLAPGARVWVTDYKTALSGPSHFQHGSIPQFSICLIAECQAAAAFIKVWWKKFCFSLNNHLFCAHITHYNKTNIMKIWFCYKQHTNNTQNILENKPKTHTNGGKKQPKTQIGSNVGPELNITVFFF